VIDPSELIHSLVALLQDIPDLVTEMGDDSERIYAYHDQYPQKSSLALAIHQMPVPAIMVAWQGTAPGNFGGSDVWKHQVSLFLRAGETSDGDQPTAYYRLFRLITKGVPESTGLPLLNSTVHASCYPMDVPSIQRATDAEGLDYFEVSMSFTEAGDE
jgi:hypothetical protein